MDSRFQSLQSAFDRASVRAQSSLEGAEPNQVLLFDCIGSITDAAKALQKVPGLQVATEFMDSVQQDSDFFIPGKPSLDLQNSFYLVIHDQRGLAELLSLWNTYKLAPGSFNPALGLAPLRGVFGHLKDIRPWGPQDRLTDQFRAVLAERIAAGDEVIPVEIELWFFSTETKRTASQERVARLVQVGGGRVLDSYQVSEISYHAVLAEIPIQSLNDLLESDDASLVRADNVMYFYPQGQALLGNLTDIPGESPSRDFPPASPGMPPVVALLDGLPQENHTSLVGCLNIEDPNGAASTYPVSNRVHGTGMASLICRGDLTNDGAPLSSPVVVYPVMRPAAAGFDGTLREELPQDKLIVKVIREAVDHVVASSPSIRIINCSLGDRNRPYGRGPSPWARLLDFLAWKHHLLFVVSAGNVTDPISVGFERRAVEQMAPSHPTLQSAALRQIVEGWIDRRIISPAEGINVLTIGAINEDGSQFTLPRHDVLLMGSNRLPACYSRQGPGVRGCVKPDILVSGGRQLRMIDLGNHSPQVQRLKLRNSIAAPGFEVAVPAPAVSGQGAYGFTRGTSIAAALTSRAAVRLHEAIANGLIEGAEPARDQMPVVLRALLAHRASWGEAGDAIDALYSGQRGKSICRRMLGFGLVDHQDFFSSEDVNSTSLIAVGYLEPEMAHRYHFPLIDELRGRTWGRTVVTTLAWATPTVAESLPYRAARLHCALFGSQRKELSPTGRTVYRPEEGHSLEDALGLNSQEHAKTAAAGTLQHTVWEGDTSMQFDSSAEHYLQVNCEQLAGGRPCAVPIPYALVVSMKVATTVRLDLHAKVKAAVQARVQVRA